MLEARIKGEGPFRLVLDSGASGTVIEAELARSLGLDVEGASTRRSTSVNSEVTIAQIRGGVEFGVAPGLDVHIPYVYAAPVTSASRIMIGEHIDGIIGSELFFRYVVEVDYEAKELTIHDPDTYRYEGDGTTFDLTFATPGERLPFVKAALVNGERRLDTEVLVDSGGQTMGTVGLSSRQDWNRLLSDEQAVVEVLGATGLSDEVEGTTHDAFATVMSSLSIGEFELAQPLVAFSPGGPSIPLIGATVLHRFTAIFDYSRKQLILEPNGAFDAPFGSDQSGLTLVNSGSPDDGLRILFVAPGTPADEIGLTTRDVILEIDGQAVDEVGLNEVRSMLSQSGVFRLLVQRGGEEKEVALRTRPLFR